MKKILVLIAFMLSTQVMAGGWGDAAAVKKIEVIRNEGLMVWADIGNPASCNGEANVFFVEKDHPQYDQVYSTILAALMSGKKIQPYVDTCKPVTWQTSASNLFNTLTPGGAIYIYN